jgi:hypothetical protein
LWRETKRTSHLQCELANQVIHFRGKDFYLWQQKQSEDAISDVNWGLDNMLLKVNIFQHVGHHVWHTIQKHEGYMWFCEIFCYNLNCY